MLKIFSHIIISILLLISTMGFAVSEHYCENRVISIAINHEAHGCSDMDDNCCHNVTHFYQVDQDFSQPQIVQAPNLACFDLFVVELNPVFQDLFVEVISENQFIYDSPPPPDIQTTLSKKQSYLL